MQAKDYKNRVIYRAEPGARIGKWTVQDERSGNKTLCRCDCGTLKFVFTHGLVRGRTHGCKSCGVPPFEAGQRFGRYEIIDPVPKVKPLCRCDCGTVRPVSGTNLRRGVTTGCGCNKLFSDGHRSVQHGLSGRPEYPIWTKIVARCTNPTIKNYHNYGGRGIGICDRWRHSFAAFLEDMGPRPGPEYSIEREDNDGNYEPGNCHWADIVEQSRNRRTNRRIEFRGRTLTAIEWSEVTGIPSASIRNRIDRAGWTVERALTTPINEKLSIKARQKRPKKASLATPLNHAEP